MEDNNEFIPTLTLDPTAEAAPAAAAVAVKPEEPAEKAAPALDMSNLSEAERKAVLEFAEKIDITDSNTVLQYGSAAQKHISAL